MAYPKTPSPAGSPTTACPTICEPNKDPCTPPKATSSTTTRSSAIEELGKRYDICEIAYDRWGVVQMSQNLEGLGFTVVPFGQGFEDMSPPSKELMKLALEHRLAHGGHPVLAWMADYVTVRQDPAGNIKPDKQNSTEKIDGIVALVMALDRAIRGGSQPTGSVYNTRGLLVMRATRGVVPSESLPLRSLHPPCGGDTEIPKTPQVVRYAREAFPGVLQSAT